MMLVKKRREMEVLKLWTNLGSSIVGLMVAWTMLEKYIPQQLRSLFTVHTQKLFTFYNPYIRIRFPEFSGTRYLRSEAYNAIHNYLSVHSSPSAKSLKADSLKEGQSQFLLSMDDDEEVTDVFQGVKLWWASRKTSPKSQSINLFHLDDEEKRYYVLTFHKKDRDLVTGDYMAHVIKEGRGILSRNRQKKLFSNNPNRSWNGWSPVIFDHPATFDTLAMPIKSKEAIIKDLLKFSDGKSYYAKIGKPWKRGYLLYGPPGTGKSTMIAAMANLLNYDIYNLELTTVKDNSELIKLLLETSGKSIIVIEDIDCSLDLTGQRNPNKNNEDSDDDDGINTQGSKNNVVSKAIKEQEKESKSDSKVTLSGLLNFIDGIWSACGGERIIVFTTNYVDKLDPALIRRGRMDMHIEMSYCCFEAFKVLAKNYLDIDNNKLFGRIEELLGEIEMTPASVAENLLPKSVEDGEDKCLRNLVEALEAIKQDQDAKLKAERREKQWQWVKSIF